jgi:hypothetical protein
VESTYILPAAAFETVAQLQPTARLGLIYYSRCYTPVSPVSVSLNPCSTTLAWSPKVRSKQLDFGQLCCTCAHTITSLTLSANPWISSAASVSSSSFVCTQNSQPTGLIDYLFTNRRHNIPRSRIERGNQQARDRSFRHSLNLPQQTHTPPPFSVLHLQGSGVCPSLRLAPARRTYHVRYLRVVIS